MSGTAAVDSSASLQARPHAGGAVRQVRIAGGLAVLMALPYITHLMPVEEEVGLWGLASFGLGTLLLAMTLARQSRATGWSELAVLIAVVLMQVLPIWFWLTLGVTTDVPWIQRGIMTRLAFAAAHGAVLLAGLWAIFAVVRSHRNGGGASV